MGRRSRLNPRSPRLQPSDYVDHPDCPDQYADMPLVHVAAGGTIVDKGGHKRPRRADTDARPIAPATSSVNTRTNQRVPVASTSVSISVFANDLDFSRGDFDNGKSMEPHLAPKYEYEDQGRIDLSAELRYSPLPDPDLQRPTHQELAQEVLPPPRASDPPLPPKRDSYLKFITAENKQRESQRAAMLGQHLDFRTNTNRHLRPLVSEDDLDDLDAPSPCDCKHVFARDVILYDVMAFYPLQVTFCASDRPCVAEAERLAQLGLIASTASKPGSAFSFRLIEQADSCWKVSPHAITGYADGLELYFKRCGWGSKHYHGHTYMSDKELWKQLQRAIDEFRALDERRRADSSRDRLGVLYKRSWVEDKSSQQHLSRLCSGGRAKR